MSGKNLTQSLNTSVQLQLLLTSSVFNSLDPYKVRTDYVRPDLGRNCLKGLSADDNVMVKFNAKLNYIGSTSTFHNL